MATNIHSDSHYTQNPDVRAEVLDGEAVLLNIQTGTYFGMNKVGTHIWELFGKGKSLSEVVESVHRRFDVTPEQAATDVHTFIQTLLERGLLIS